MASTKNCNYSVKFGWDTQKRPKSLSVVVGPRLRLISKADRATVIRALKDDVTMWLNELK